MLVYHGSYKTIEKPDIKYSQKYLDFGSGFYVTEFKEQAERWAKRKGLRQGEEPVVSIYDFEEKLKNFKIKEFNDSSEWLDFVCACRKGESIYKNFDIIIGDVANDDVFKTVDMYFRGLWDKKRTLKEISYFDKSNQINFTNNEVINKCLTFNESYKVL